MEITYSTLRTVCGEHILQELLEHRNEVSNQLEHQIFHQVKTWGVYVDHVFIKDM